jgi:hypothetical protein
MDDTDHALFSRFSAELVVTALKDTPVVMVMREVPQRIPEQEPFRRLTARRGLIRDLERSRTQLLQLTQ